MALMDATRVRVVGVEVDAAMRDEEVKSCLRSKVYLYQQRIETVGEFDIRYSGSKGEYVQYVPVKSADPCKRYVQHTGRVYGLRVLRGSWLTPRLRQRRERGPFGNQINAST